MIAILGLLGFSAGIVALMIGIAVFLAAPAIDSGRPMVD